MEQRMKFILIGLLGVLAISGFFIFQFYTAKVTVEKQRDALISDNETLKKRAEDSLQKARGLQDKLAALSQELDKVTSDKQDIEKRLAVANKEKQELIDRLKARQAQMEVPKPTVKEVPTEAFPQATEAYWAQILKAKTDLEFQLSTLRNDFRSTQITNEQLQREKRALDLDAKNLARDNEDLKRQLGYNQKLLDSISQELVREKNDKIVIEDGLKPLKTENTSLRKQLNSLDNQKISLERKFQQLKEDKDALADRLEKMGVTLKEKISSITELKEQAQTPPPQVAKEAPSEKKEAVELPPIVVRPQAELGPRTEAAKQEGGILAINRENNFVIINLGQDSGLKAGDALQVYRDGKPIAALEVIQSRRSIAACDIKKETTPVKIGDAVR